MSSEEDKLYQFLVVTNEAGEMLNVEQVHKDYRDDNEKDPSINMFYKKVHNTHESTIPGTAYDDIMATSRKPASKYPDKITVSQ